MTEWSFFVIFLLSGITRCFRFIVFISRPMSLGNLGLIKV